MNLVEKGKELEYVPEPKLIEMARNPEGQYPQFLVLSEIQKRNQMRRMYKNQMAKMNQPTTTVAEESVMELAGQGAVPMMDSLSSLSSPEGGLRSMAPTPMKSGKKTEIERDEAELSEELRELLAKDRRYAQQYKDYESRERFFPPLVPRDFIVSDDEYNRIKRSGAYMREGNLQDYRPFLALLGALSGESGPRYMPESKVKGLQAMVEATRKEKQMQQMGMQQGGITKMQSGGILGISGDSLSQSFINPMEQQISNQELQRTQSILDMLPRNEDGSIDKSEIAKAVGSGLLTAGAVAAILIPEPTSSALGTARLASTGLGKNLFQLPGKIKSGLQSFMGKRELRKDPTKRFGPENTQGLKPLQTTKQVGQQKIKDLKIPTRLTGLTGLSVAGAMVGDGEDEIKLSSDTDLTEAEKRAASSLQDLQKLLDKPTDTTTTEKQGFASDDFLTLAQLGGIVGGATNLGEAAMGIGNLAGQIQKTRRESGLEGAQRSLLEAQTAKYIADVANMDLDNALQQYSAIPKLVESGVLTPEEAKIREAALIQRINEFQGTATNTSQKSYSQFVS